MGKVALLGFLGATIAILINLNVLSGRYKPIAVSAFGIFVFFASMLLMLDLKCFLESPYPLRTKILEILLSTLLGEYFDTHRCWINWKLCLYGNQFFAKEVFFEQWEYPALYTLDDSESDLENGLENDLESGSENELKNLKNGSENDIGNLKNGSENDTENLKNGSENVSPVDNRNFKTELFGREQRCWYNIRSTGLDDDWGANESNVLQRVTSIDKNKVCFRFFSIGDCHLKVKALIENPTQYTCIVEVYRGGAAKKFAKHVEHFKDPQRVELLLAYLDACQASPKTGVVDLRKGGVSRDSKIIYSFRIQDAMKLINNSKCILVTCKHLDHGFWVL